MKTDMPVTGMDFDAALRLSMFHGNQRIISQEFEGLEQGQHLLFEVFIFVSGR